MRIGNPNCELKEDLSLNLSLKSFIYYHKTVVQRDHKLDVVIMHMHEIFFVFRLKIAFIISDCAMGKARASCLASI